MSAIDALAEVARQASKARSALQRAQYASGPASKDWQMSAARAAITLAQTALDEAAREMRPQTVDEYIAAYGLGEDDVEPPSIGRGRCMHRVFHPGLTCNEYDGTLGY